ncbi:hypothetical protein PV10_05997 [Exophiala mesophila]|uniref:Major facilitator superfamily (MFS) profile domain-containing protein n=1 Tax=Exophiala mesophila TaxID=212818 RepID=A0A0D1XTI0_EXOME|nr:uncharacterized protein PV10_05997 [Exophiala mesophila]KIV91461.1 hypothetical protein PV10_05997 [Exophiala mesophila]
MTDSSVEEKHETAPEAMHQEALAPAVPDDSNNAPVPEQRMTIQNFFAFLSLAMTPSPPVIVLVLIATILVQVASDVGYHINYSWIASAWSIGASMAFTIAGNISDIFGRRYTILFGQSIAFVGLIIGAAANSTELIVVANAILGFSTGIASVSYAGLSEVLPNRWRGAGVAVTELIIIVPWVGASCLIAIKLFSSTALSWRWIYIIGLIYQVLGIVGIFAFYFPPKPVRHLEERSRFRKLAEIDFIGCILYIGGLCCVLIAFSWAGSEYAWDSAAVLAPLLIGLATLVLFGVFEYKFASHPLLPPILIRQGRGFVLLAVVATVLGTVYYGMSTMYPQAALYLFSTDPVEIGLIQLPGGMGQIFFGVIAPTLTSKVGHLKIQLVVSTGIQTLFYGLSALSVPGHKAMFMTFQVFSLGMFPIILTLVYIIAGFTVPISHLGLALGLIGTLRSGGGSLGISVLSTVLQSYTSANLGPAISEAALKLGYAPENLGQLIEATIEDGVGVPFAFESVPGITPAIESACQEVFKQVYAVGFQHLFYVAAGISFVGFVAAVFTTDASHHLTAHTAVMLEHANIFQKSPAQDVKEELR